MNQIRIVENAFPGYLFGQVQSYAWNQDYSGAVSPLDGVEYPDICPHVPAWIRGWIYGLLVDEFPDEAESLEIHQQFFRLTTKNTEPAPHQAHNDAIHGSHACFLYVNESPGHVDGHLCGTSLLTHKSGLHPGDDGFEEVWKKDTNNYGAWDVNTMLHWKPNRMLIIPSERMHRAEPPGGWGEDATDGRLVLITFFSC